MTTSPPGAVQIYPRDCFSCGEPMVLVAKGSITLTCKECEITENGTINGKFLRDTNSGGLWGNEMIPYLDHGETNAPSPDSEGYREPRRSSAPVAPAEDASEDGAA